MSEELLSVRDAAAQGIERLRRPNWTHPMDHLKIDLVRGSVGPWLHFHSPMNTWINGRDPVSMLAMFCGDLDERVWLPYRGPLPHSPEYNAAATEFNSSARPLS